MDSFETQIRQTFLDEAEQLLGDVEQCFLKLEHSENADNTELINKIFRLVHSLKGSAKAVGFLDLGELTHAMETLLVQVRHAQIDVSRNLVDGLLECVDTIAGMVRCLREDLSARYDISEALRKLSVLSVVSSDEAHAVVHEEKPAENDDGIIFNQEELAKYKNQHGSTDVKERVQPTSLNTGEFATERKAGSDESIRVNVKRIDKLINNVGELVILQTMLSQQRHLVPSRLMQLTISQLEKITHEIHDISMGLRMVPLKGVFQKMQRIVRDVSVQLEKEIVMEMEGEETELDRTMLEQISDPLVHLVRNAVDHGIESGAERIEKGKSVPAKIRLKAFHMGGRVVLEVSDDGRGLDTAKIMAKAKERGLIPQDADLSPSEARDLIFASGFSTKDVVTDVSGRGVGMDVVRSNISALQGEIEIESTSGQGSTFRIYLPLTLSIIEAMIIRLAEDRYVIPSTNIHESLRPERNDVGFVAERGELLNLRGEILPIYRLHHLLGHGARHNSPVWENIAIVVRPPKHEAYVILVDDIVSKQHVVIKRLGEEISDLPGVSGGAILGDGKAALILDLGELVERVQGHAQRRLA